MKKVMFALASSCFWITFSEFIRNEFLIRFYWQEHYQTIGLTFKTLPINGVLWIIWSFVLSYMLFKLLSKFKFFEAVFLGWIFTFLMMWITLYNLQVLPLKILLPAIPLSFLEIMVAEIMIQKIMQK